MSMLIYPAIDLRGGKVVRLKEGDPTRQTVFSDDPVATAQAWAADGAKWIHMVNLDGAFAAANGNGVILEAIAKLNVPVQFGGGLRRIDDVQEAIERGASRVVLGTAAIERPELLVEAVQRWGEDCVCVALDARDGKVTTHGWQNTTEMTPIELGKQMGAMGIRHALYTDVNRDGGLSGVNIHATVTLAQETGLAVIASGGVSTVDEIRQLSASGVVAGAVIGMALYEGRMTLPEAIEAAGDSNAG
jgi:phosphoribosylformimino-5-aminoimidazole carboxamide ribotide isomerase